MSLQRIAKDKKMKCISNLLLALLDFAICCIIFVLAVVAINLLIQIPLQLILGL